MNQCNNRYRRRFSKKQGLIEVLRLHLEKAVNTMLTAELTT